MPTPIVTIADLEAKARRVLHYTKLRQEHPDLPIRKVWGYVRYSEVDGEDSLEEYVCNVTGGHRWVYSGSALGNM